MPDNPGSRRPGARPVRRQAAADPGQHERRLACPVCIGVVMQKLQPVAGQPLVLDACRRCGGVWFDSGEVAALRRSKPEALWTTVELKPEAFRMKCHRCQASMGRNAKECPACGWENILTCPACQGRLTPVEREGLRLDACRRCRGVWFDNTELAAIWNKAIAGTAVERRGQAPAGMAADNFLFDMVLFSTLTNPYLGVAGAHVIGGVVSGVGELAAPAAEAAGEAASSVFGVIADLIGSIFDGF